MHQYSMGKYHLSIITNTSCYGDAARDSLTTEVLKHNPDYILWIDADQVYPMNTPEVLMNHIKDGKLVAGGITPHGGTGHPLVYKMLHPSGICKPRAVSLNQGMIQVDACGTGGVMMSPKVFEIMKSPWWRMMWNTRAGCRPGMDFQFYAHCKEAGIDVWIDTDLVFGHVVTGLREMREPTPEEAQNEDFIGDYLDPKHWAEAKVKSS